MFVVGIVSCDCTKYVYNTFHTKEAVGDYKRKTFPKTVASVRWQLRRDSFDSINKQSSHKEKLVYNTIEYSTVL